MGNVLNTSKKYKSFMVSTPTIKDWDDAKSFAESLYWDNMKKRVKGFPEAEKKLLELMFTPSNNEEDEDNQMIKDRDKMISDYYCTKEGIFWMMRRMLVHSEATATEEQLQELFDDSDFMKLFNSMLIPNEKVKEEKTMDPTKGARKDK